jgi:hypothetical protein
MASFCGVLSDPSNRAAPLYIRYPIQRHVKVKRHGIDFLNQQVHHLWLTVKGPRGTFQWALLMDAKNGRSRRPLDACDERRFNSNTGGPTSIRQIGMCWRFLGV